MSMARKMKRAAQASLKTKLLHAPTGLPDRSLIASHRSSLHDKELINQTLARSVDYWMTCTLLALHDEFGFGIVRLQRAYDKICGIASCIGAGTIQLSDLQHFIGCNFDEGQYEKLFGKEFDIPVPKAEEQLKTALPVSLPEGLREKLVDAANADNMTLNQYVVKVLKASVEKAAE